jgi:hypothetical protein
MNQFTLLKSHIDAYTRKDGAVVHAHDDKRQPTSVSNKLQKLAASGWKAAAHKKVAGHSIIDSPAVTKDGPIDGVRRISVVRGGHIAHFHYNESEHNAKSAAEESAVSYAKSRKDHPIEPYY